MKESRVPTFAELVDWVEGRLSAEASQQIAAWLETADVAGREDVAWLQQFHELRQKLAQAKLPAETRRKLARRFDVYAQGRRSRTAWRRLTAWLLFDSQSQPALAGVRSVAADQERQLVYATKAMDVALNIHSRRQKTAVTFDLMGQILPNDPDAGSRYLVQLLHQQVEQNARTTDATGEFDFTAVQPGVYDLVIIGEQFELVVPSIELLSS